MHGLRRGWSAVACLWSLLPSLQGAAAGVGEEPTPPLGKSVELLLTRLEELRIDSPILKIVPPGRVSVDLGELIKVGEMVLPGEDSAVRVYGLPASVEVDDQGRPADLVLLDPAGNPLAGESPVRVVPALLKLEFHQMSCCDGFQRRRTALGRMNVCVDRTAEIAIPMVRHGGRLRVRFHAQLLPRSVDPTGLPSGPPRITLRIGEEQFAQTLGPQGKALFDFTFQAHFGPQEMTLQVDLGAPSLGSAYVALQTLTLEVVDHIDRLLLPLSLAVKGTVVCYRAAPVQDSVLLSASDDAPAESVQWQGSMLAGRAMIRSARPQVMELCLDGQRVASTQGPAQELEFEVKTSGPHRLELLFPQKSRGRAWLVQPLARFARLLNPATPSDDLLAGVRGVDSIESFHPLVRHVRVEGDARLSLIAAPSTEARVEVKDLRNAVLEFSAATIALSGEDVGARAPLTLEVTLFDGSFERAILKEEITPRQDWRELRVDLSRLQLDEASLCFKVSAKSSSLAVTRDDICAIAEPRILRPSSKQPPNLLIYLVDTLRADHVSAYGYSRPTTPSIDQLAREGILFERAYSQAPWTRPSVASLMTGLLYSFHGASKANGLSPELYTLAERMRDRGYQTAAFLANPYIHGQSLNFEQGFGTFVALDPEDGNERASNLNAEVIPWLERNHDRPFFAYVHSIDPHAEYDPPAETKGVFNHGYEGTLAPGRTHGSVLDAMEGLTEADLQYLLDLYDEEILFNDGEIGRLLQLLRDRSVYDDTIIVVLSDHGEEFREHGAFGHGGRLWEELIKVPLIVKWNGGPAAPHGIRVPDPVRVIDVLPTLADWLQWQETPDSFQGVSLRAGWTGQDLPLLEVISEEEPRLRCLVQGDFKIIEQLGDPSKSFRREEQIWLFDLDNDPSEQFNLALVEDDRVGPWREKLHQALRTYQERGFRAPAGFATRMTPEEVAALQQLGYLDQEQ